jgi:hypothetical protein
MIEALRTRSRVGVVGTAFALAMLPLLGCAPEPPVVIDTSTKGDAPGRLPEPGKGQVQAKMRPGKPPGK